MAVRFHTLSLALALTTSLGLAACSNTARGVAQDTSELANNVKSGAETVDVKTALISDATLDADSINVDTYADKKLIVLRGSVPTEDDKREAEEIARKEAPGYRIDNQLAIVPKKPGGK